MAGRRDTGVGGCMGLVDWGLGRYGLFVGRVDYRWESFSFEGVSFKMTFCSKIAKLSYMFQGTDVNNILYFIHIPGPWCVYISSNSKTNIVTCITLTAFCSRLL